MTTAGIKALLGDSSFEFSTKEIKKLTAEPYYGACNGKLAKALAEVADPCGATLGVQGKHGLMDISAMKPDADGFYEILNRPGFLPPEPNPGSPGNYPDRQ